METTLLAQADGGNGVLMFILAVIVGWFGFRIWLNWKSRQLDQKIADLEKMKPLIDLSDRVIEHCEKIESMKGTTARVNRCKRALNDIKALRAYPNHGEVITNLDELEERFHSMIKVFPVIDKVSRAYKHRFAGKDNLERSALVDALYAVQLEQVTNEDFIRAEVFPEGAYGEVVQIDDLINRAKALGWEGPMDGTTI